jgi:hypothetical protein
MGNACPVRRIADGAAVRPYLGSLTLAATRTARGRSQLRIEGRRPRAVESD